MNKVQHIYQSVHKDRLAHFRILNGGSLVEHSGDPNFEDQQIVDGDLGVAMIDCKPYDHDSVSIELPYSDHTLHLSSVISGSASFGQKTIDTSGYCGAWKTPYHKRTHMATIRPMYKDSLIAVKAEQLRAIAWLANYKDMRVYGTAMLEFAKLAGVQFKLNLHFEDPDRVKAVMSMLSDNSENKKRGFVIIPEVLDQSERNRLLKFDLHCETVLDGGQAFTIVRR